MEKYSLTLKMNNRDNTNPFIYCGSECFHLEHKADEGIPKLDAMKKIMFTVVLLFASVTTFAQDNKFEVGFEVGPNLMAVTNQNTDLGLFKLKPNVGIHIGGNFQYNFHPIFSLRTGLHYQHAAIQTKEITLGNELAIPIGTFELKYQLDYLSVPLLVRASFGNTVQFFANAGINLSVLTSQNYWTSSQIQTGPSDFSSSEIRDKTNVFNRFQIAATAGIGVNIPIKEQFTFSVEARNHFALNELYEREQFINPESIPNTHSNITSLTIGLNYKF